MKTFNLIKRKNGHRNGEVVSQFSGKGLDDQQMISEVNAYLKMWLNGYNGSISDKEIDEILKDFENCGGASYDVWNFHLMEDKYSEE